MRISDWSSDVCSSDLVDQVATTQVATVAVCAQPMTCFASQGRTHLDFVYAYAVDVFDRVFVEQRTSGYSRFLRLGVDDINRRYATKDTVPQGFADLAAFEPVCHGGRKRIVEGQSG